jgi:hypothetical protein
VEIAGGMVFRGKWNRRIWFFEKYLPTQCLDNTVLRGMYNIVELSPKAPIILKPCYAWNTMM